MILASAQTQPKNGDVQGNLNDHYSLIELAASHRAHLVLFPELSLTGYERERALDLAFTADDSRLATMRAMSAKYQIIVVAGAPILMDEKLHIGSFILYPDGTESIYTKQYLHEGEEEYFRPSFGYNPIIELEQEQISLAICADIDHPEHAAAAYKANSTIYLASLFFTPNGIPEAQQALSKYAQQYGMNILMSNYTGNSWGLEAGGHSGFWANTGELVHDMGAKEVGLMIVEKQRGNWLGKTISSQQTQENA